MSVTTAVVFDLLPSETGYILTMDFPFLESKKEVPFMVEEPPKDGATFDLYSQNGKVGGEHPLTFFMHRDVTHIRKAVELPLPEEGKVQKLFVLDLCDEEGKYGDLESIRQG